MQSTPWLLFPCPENLIRLRRGRGERGTVLCLRLCLRLCLKAVCLKAVCLEAVCLEAVCLGYAGNEAVH